MKKGRSRWAGCGSEVVLSSVGVLSCHVFLSVRPRWCGGPKDVPGRGRRRQLR